MRQVHGHICLVLLAIVCCFHTKAQDPHKVDSVLQVANTTTSDSMKAEAYGYLALQTVNSNPTLARYYADKSLKFTPQGNEAFRASGLLAKASIFRNIGMLDSSVNLINQALDIANRTNNKLTLSKCYMELGLVSQTQNNADKALEFYTKCLTIQRLAKMNLAIPGTLNNIGIIYTMKEDWPTALQYFKKSLRANLDYHLYSALGNDYNNLGVVFIIKKQYDSAQVYLDKGLEYRRQNHDLLGIGGSYNNMALMQKELKNTKKALQLADSALSIAKQIGSKKLELEVYGSYHEIYTDTKNYEQALKAYTRFNALQRELSKESSQEKIEQMQKSMALEMKERELLEKDLALMKSENEQEKKNRVLLLFVGGIIVLGGFVIYVFRINRKLKNVNAIISEQKNVIQEKHKDITDSINYAQKIQTALIMSEKALQKRIGNAFVLFRPRDVVSGDFYWFTEKNGKKLLAVADCTGHGVPGAFMSMIGITLLNQIVNEKGITSPAAILDHLREGVISSLNQTGEESGKRDGMDVALIAWDEQSLTYAGANNACLVLRDGVFTELKPNKQPVGLYEKQEPFTEQKTELRKNDTVYLFTDGITDQFGGEKGKKIKLKGLKEWLTELSKHNMTEQKEGLEQKLNSWKNNVPQTDDILVVGIAC